MKAMFYKINLLVSISIFLWLNNGYAQNSELYISWFDNKVGPENTALYNGYLDDGEGDYERTRSFKGTQRYFKDYNFITGSVTYEGQIYPNQQIKYDLYKDELLLNLKSSKGSSVKVQLINNRIQSFSLANHSFINLNSFDVKTEIYKGFAEKLFTGSNFIFFTKHKKTRSERIIDKKVLFEYFAANSNLIYFEDNFHLLKRKKDLTKLFPEYKKEMREYTIRKSTTTKDILNYLVRLNSLMTEKAKTK